MGSAEFRAPKNSLGTNIPMPFFLTVLLSLPCIAIPISARNYVVDLREFIDGPMN